MYLLNLIMGIFIIYDRLNNPLIRHIERYPFEILPEIIADMPLVIFLQLCIIYLTNYISVLNAIQMVQIIMLVHFKPAYSLFWGVANNIIYNYVQGDWFLLIFLGIYFNIGVRIWN